MPDLRVIRIEDQDPRLGRQVVHDERSRSFALGLSVDRSSWHDKAIRLYDPRPNPNQDHGNCTGCAKAMQFNAIGNRISGKVLTMSQADLFYSVATRQDPFEGEWPPVDTGSSGLASAQAAMQLGEGGEYRWLFDGVDEVVQTVMAGVTVSIGTWWWDSMFDLDSRGALSVSGSKVGGHQYVARGYDVSDDEVICRCWWGDFRDFRIKRGALGELIEDYGDAHTQVRAMPAVN